MGVYDCDNYNDLMARLDEKRVVTSISPAQMSGTSDNSKQQRVFKKLVKDKKGYYSIIWEEDGEENEGYSSFSLDVISDFLKEYFIQEPKQADSGSASCINHENTHVRTTDDLISRQVAIDTLYKMLHDCFLADDEELDAVITTLNELPSVTPRSGKWRVINKFEDCCYAKCNQCNMTQVFYYNKPLTNFCPNCGADMRCGEHDG